MTHLEHEVIIFDFRFNNRTIYVILISYNKVSFSECEYCIDFSDQWIAITGLKGEESLNGGFLLVQYAYSYCGCWGLARAWGPFVPLHLHRKKRKYRCFS